MSPRSDPLAYFIGLPNPAAELGIELVSGGEHKMVDEQVARVGGDTTKAWTLHPARQVEVAFQSSVGQRDSGKDPFLSAEADLPRDRRILSRPSGLDQLGNGVKERDHCRGLTYSSSTDSTPTAPSLAAEARSRPSGDHAKCVVPQIR
jgi:hypothetical protein